MNKEKPIIFSTPMVQAILAERKTMTRRVVKNQDGIHPRWNTIGWLGWDDGHGYKMRQPYDVGDMLWVRETWRVEAWDDAGSICVDYKADGFTRREWIRISDPNLYEELWQQSSDDARKTNTPIDDDGNYYWDPGKGPTRWRSPVTMPREAARLFLRVKDVRVERVQDIRFTDALSEGVKPDFTEYEGRLEHPVIAIANAISAQNSSLVAFKKHWNARNAKHGYGWGSNPWVWVIEFERVDKP